MDTELEEAVWLVDSDVLIDVSRGKEAARQLLLSLGDSWRATSVKCLRLTHS